jgi:AcrR family transcriptional regulator
VSTKVTAAGVAQDRATLILDSAWTLVVERGVDFTMKDVAAAAGVSRQTVYSHVGSRAGLFVAMARHHDARAGIARRFQAALAAPTGRRALDATIRTWFEYVPTILPVARALWSAAATDEDAATAWWDRMDHVRLTMRRVIERLAGEGALDGRWTVEEAADILWSLTHPRAWDDLIGHRGWESGRFVDRQVEIAGLILIGPDSVSP